MIVDANAFLSRENEEVATKDQGNLNRQSRTIANIPIRELTHNFKKTQKKVLDGEIIKVGQIYLSPFPPLLLDEGMKAINGNITNNLEMTNEVLNILREFKNKSSF